MKKEKRFPTILGLLVLIIAIIGGVYLTSSRTNFGTKAANECNPINLQVASITYNSADISFTTAINCLSNLSVNGQVIEDVRFLNTNQSPTAIKVHYFQIKNLKENTEYPFSLISGGKTIVNNEFKFVTSSKPASPIPTSNLAWGRVLNPDKKTTSNAIVYLNIPGAAPLSSFVTSNGNWSISLASSFNDQNNDWFSPLQDPIEEDIVVIAEDGTITQVTNTTNMNNPVPDIVIGQNSLTVPSDYQSISQGVIISISPAQTQKNITITNPVNGESLTSLRPDFFGSGPINSTIIIEVNSSVLITGQTQSSASGTWNWSPPQNLSPGEHTITAKVQNTATGLWQTVTNRFTILAQNNSNLPAYEASGSATIQPTQIPTLQPTDTPLPTPTDIVRTARPSTSSGEPPVSGNSLPTTIILISAVLLFFISFKFLK